MAKRDSNFNPINQTRGVRRNTSGTADWATADATLLRTAIERASITGGAIRCGYSRDGGAYAIGIYGDGEPYTEFVRPSEDVNEFLQKVIELFEDIADDVKSSTDSSAGRK